MTKTYAQDGITFQVTTAENSAAVIVTAIKGVPAIATAATSTGRAIKNV